MGVGIGSIVPHLAQGAEEMKQNGRSEGPSSSNSFASAQAQSQDYFMTSRAFYDAITKAQTFWKTTPGYLQAVA
jgi:hypothetical protein